MMLGVIDTEVVMGADTEVVMGGATSELVGPLSKSLSLSLLLLLKTARIAAEVEPQNGIGFLVDFAGRGVRIGVQLLLVVEVARVVDVVAILHSVSTVAVEEVVEVAHEVDAIEILHSVSAVAVEEVLSPWCCCQCVRAKACCCLSDHGFDFFFFCLHTGALRALGAQGLKNTS